MEDFRYYALKLCGIIILIFLLQLIIKNFTDFLVLKSSIVLERPWTLITSIFLHGGIVHLFNNIFALGLFGSILEKTINTKNFIVLFFVSGIFASIISTFFYDATLGASGAIFGIIGALTILKPKMIIWFQGMPLPLFIAAMLWAFLDIIGAYTPSNIANLAHLSGLGFGLIFGLFFRYLR